MASIYYGTCDTAALTDVKVVVVPSMFGENGVNPLNEGDLLVVLFSNKNSIVGPKIAISNGDASYTTNHFKIIYIILTFSVSKNLSFAISPSIN